VVFTKLLTVILSLEVHFHPRYYKNLCRLFALKRLLLFLIARLSNEVLCIPSHLGMQVKPNNLKSFLRSSVIICPFVSDRFDAIQLRLRPDWCHCFEADQVSVFFNIFLHYYPAFALENFSCYSTVSYVGLSNFTIVEIEISFIIQRREGGWGQTRDIF
jgi:hypothetical protein